MIWTMNSGVDDYHGIEYAYKCYSTDDSIDKGEKMSLTKVMKEKGVTTQKLSDMTGMNKRTLENYRTGHRKMSLETGLMIAKVLNADPYDLLDDKGKKADTV